MLATIGVLGGALFIAVREINSSPPIPRARL
jgi:hypothetical protein